MTEPEQICVQPVSAVWGYPGRSTVHPTYENSSSICLFREQNKLTRRHAWLTKSRRGTPLTIEHEHEPLASLLTLTLTLTLDSGNGLGCVAHLISDGILSWTPLYGHLTSC